MHTHVHTYTFIYTHHHAHDRQSVRACAQVRGRTRLAEVPLAAAASFMPDHMKVWCGEQKNPHLFFCLQLQLACVFTPTKFPLFLSQDDAKEAVATSAQLPVSGRGKSDQWYL
jgi:hypothetical protein